MSAFGTLFSEVGRPMLNEHLGQTVTLTNPGESSVSLTALVTELSFEEDEDLDGRTLNYRRTLIVGRDETADGGGVPTPKKGATANIDGVVWTVEGIESQSESLTRLRIVRPVKTEQSRTGFRGERR